MSAPPIYYRHGLRRMLGRSQGEQHRAATPLELLFDLTFVAAFGVAGNELAHGIAEGHAASAVPAFAFALVAIVWAWVNYSWFASAFDTDDWLFRLLTMVQMAGVIVLAIGIPPVFAQLEAGVPVDNAVMVAGYVVMRLALIAQWLRAAHSNPEYRVVSRAYAVIIGAAQLGWVIAIVLPLDPLGFVLWASVVAAIDWSSPIIAEGLGKRRGAATPWHAHHIAERYSLLAIIALGETVIGTLSAAQSISASEGWSGSTIAVIALGVIMTFGLWWTYFMVPSAPVLAARRDKAWLWAYGHAPVFASIAAIGAGLHVVGFVFDPHLEVSTLTAIVSVAVPVLVFMVSLYLLHSWLVSTLPKNAVLQLTTLGLPVAAIALAAIGMPLWTCLLLVALAPVSIVVTYELGSWRALEAQLVRVIG